MIFYFIEKKSLAEYRKTNAIKKFLLDTKQLQNTRKINKIL